MLAGFSGAGLVCAFAYPINPVSARQRVHRVAAMSDRVNREGMRGDWGWVWRGSSSRSARIYAGYRPEARILCALVGGGLWMLLGSLM